MQSCLQPSCNNRDKSLLTTKHKSKTSPHRHLLIGEYEHKHNREETSGLFTSPYFWIIVWLMTMMTSSNGNIFRVTGHLCGELSGPGEFPTQRPVKRSFDVFFDLRLNNWLSKQSWGWWFEMLSCPLWSHRNAVTLYACHLTWLMWHHSYNTVSMVDADGLVCI